MIKIGSTDISKLYMGDTEVTKAYLGSTLVYENATDYSKMPLTLEVVSGGTIYLKGNNISRSVEYSINDGAWTSGTFADSTGTSISVQSGDIVKFRGDNANYATGSSANCCFSGNTTSLKFNVYGNIMSLIDSTGYTTASAFTSDNAVRAMFDGCKAVVSAEHLILPATTLTDSCYVNFFKGCSSLTTAPELPATTLANNCYSSMFQDCTSLTTAPELPATTLAFCCYYYMFRGCRGLTTAPSVLPATTLAEECYERMFQDCSSLTSAPELPATTLAKFSYYYMFYGCNSLNYIKCLATDISAQYCTYRWVVNVAATGTFVKNQSMNNWTTGDSGIPTNWTVQNYPDYTEIPLTFEIVSGGTFAIGRSQSDLEYSVDEGTTWITPNPNEFSINVNAGDKILLRGNITTTYNDFNWQQNTSVFKVYGNIMSIIDSTGYTTATTVPNSAFKQMFAFISNNIVSAENLVIPVVSQNCCQSMFSYCYKLTTAPTLPATTLPYGCYTQMFSNCTGLTSAPELPATTLAGRCYYMMFANCKSLTTAPELPATTLESDCYRFMFQGCTNIIYIKCLATDISAYDCTTNWVNGVSATGTFVKDANMTSWSTGVNGIPSGWTVQDAS